MSSDSPHGLHGPSPIAVATFNLHAGMDGYGRRFDVVDACRVLSADVIILQEAFAPVEGPSQAHEVATALGYESVELPLSRAWRLKKEIAHPPEMAWEPHKPYPHSKRALRVTTTLRHNDPSARDFEEGTWGIAVLTREPVVTAETIELGRLRRDFTARAALSLVLASGLRVVGTHMAHSTHGSLIHLRNLSSALPKRTEPAVLAGDMNFWGPPLELLLPGWRRAAKGKSWPSWRPRHQLDHLFVTPPVTSLAGGPVQAGNSDHLPMRAVLSFNPVASDQVRQRE
ncbi:MAG: endonuclease/exonuclease/phosphatase family protein [Acidimicrobiales bacterium]